MPLQPWLCSLHQEFLYLNRISVGTSLLFIGNLPPRSNVGTGIPFIRYLLDVHRARMSRSSASTGPFDLRLANRKVLSSSDRQYSQDKGERKRTLNMRTGKHADGRNIRLCHPTRSGACHFCIARRKRSERRGKARKGKDVLTYG